MTDVRLFVANDDPTCRSQGVEAQTYVAPAPLAAPVSRELRNYLEPDYTDSPSRDSDKDRLLPKVRAACGKYRQLPQLTLTADMHDVTARVLVACRPSKAG